MTDPDRFVVAATDRESRRAARPGSIIGRRECRPDGNERSRATGHSINPQASDRRNRGRLRTARQAIQPPLPSRGRRAGPPVKRRSRRLSCREAGCPRGQVGTGSCGRRNGRKSVWVSGRLASTLSGVGAAAGWRAETGRLLAPILTHRIGSRTGAGRPSQEACRATSARMAHQTAGCRQAHEPP